MELGLIMTANFSLYEMRFDKGIDAKELQKEETTEPLPPGFDSFLP